MRSNLGCQSHGICTSRHRQQVYIEPWELLHTLTVFLGGTQMGVRGRECQYGCSALPNLVGTACTAREGKLKVVQMGGRLRQPWSQTGPVLSPVMWLSSG